MKRVQNMAKYEMQLFYFATDFCEIFNFSGFALIKSMKKMCYLQL